MSIRILEEAPLRGPGINDHSPSLSIGILIAELLFPLRQSACGPIMPTDNLCSSRVVSAVVVVVAVVGRQSFVVRKA